MRRVLILLIAFMFIGCTSHPFEGWSREDTYRQAAFTALHGIDWAQTREIAQDDRFYEGNPIMGAAPSLSGVDMFMGIFLVIGLMLPALLKPCYRDKAQYVMMSVKAGVIVHNYQMGIRF